MQMPFDNFFGFSLNKKKQSDTKSSSIKAISPKEMEEDALYNEMAAAGGTVGTYINFDPSFKDEKEQIDRYREIALIPEVESAIDDILNEAIVIENDYPVSLDLDNIEDVSDKIKEKIIDEFKNIMKLMDFKQNAHENFRRWYIDGKSYYHIIVNDKKLSDGIYEVRWIDCKHMKKIINVEKKKVGQDIEEIEKREEFYMYSKDESSTGLQITPDSIAYITSGLYDPSTRRILSHLHKAIKPANQLKLMEDSLIIYRVARAPERRVFYVDIGNLPKQRGEEYLKKTMNRIKNKIVYNANTGTIVDSKVHLSMLEDYWLPRREGNRGTEVTTLPSGQNLGELSDIEYFHKKLLKALNVPITRLESESGFTLGRSSEITRDELKFTKFIQRLRIRFSHLFDQLLRVQLLLKKIITEEDWQKIADDIVYEYASDSQFSEIKKLEILTERMQLLQMTADYSGRYLSDAWIRKNILSQNEQEIKEIDDEIEEQKKKLPPVDEFGNPIAPAPASQPPQNDTKKDDDAVEKSEEDEEEDQEKSEEDEDEEKEDEEKKKKKALEKKKKEQRKKVENN